MRISLIGAGAMGTAFVKGVVTSGFLAASDVYAFDTDNARVKLLIDEFGCVGAGSARDAVREGDYIVVCVKPALVRGVLEDLQA
ncbi:MAG: NAD(P)-binding domain-containing protein, partial [Armatimonadota bacterium]